MRHVTLVLVALCSVAVVAAQNGEPRFEAISIKRNTTGATGWSVGGPPGSGWRMTNGTVMFILQAAFPTKNRDVVNLPSWASTERYDLATTVATRPSRDEEQLMLRTLLAERFNFRGHIEQREVPVFALVVARPDRSLPPTFQRLAVDCAALDAARRRGEVVTPEPLKTGEPPCGYSMQGAAGIVLTSKGMTMGRLAETLSGAAGRPVIDRTSLPGDYAFTLTYDLPRTAATNDVPTVFTALPEQLGLKLEPARAPLDTLVIDHIERPTEN